MKETDRSLKLLVLALVRSGVNTPYLLRRDAGISLGASGAALLKLRKQQLLRKSEEGKRGKAEYSLTTKGNAYLDAGVEGVFDDEEKNELRDVESVIRILCIAFDSGNEVRAFPIIENAIEVRTRRIREFSSRTWVGGSSGSKLAERYRAFLSDKRRATLAAEIEWLARLQKQIGTLRPKKSMQPKRNS
jgi:DNA-binding PadR family transcriptional regulator